MGKKMKDFIIVTEDGVMGAGIKDSNVVLAMLLHAYLQVWNNDVFEIDILETGKKIVDLMEHAEQSDEEELDLEQLLKMLFGEDDDDGET